MQSMYMDSMVIEDRTESRFSFLYIKFFLELVGYKVLEDRKHELASTPECSFRRIIFAHEAELESNDIFLCISDDGQEKIAEHQLLWKLSARLALSEEDQKSLERLAEEYDKNLFQALYTVTYLYASRYANYENQEKLKSACRALALKSSEKEEVLLNAAYTWRDVYAYLYLVNRTNEGVYKLRARCYRPVYMLDDWIKKLEELTRNYQNTSLLKAELCRNTEVSIRDHLSNYEGLQNSASYCTRFWARYAKSELLMEIADIKYSEVYGDDDCKIRVEYNKPSMEVYESCLVMKRDEIRIVYKLALQEERKGVAESRYVEEALKQFAKIESELSQIPVSQRTTLEFEYLYKTRLRQAYLYRLKGKYDTSKETFEAADTMWAELSKYTLFHDIYGEETDAVKEMLEKRHGTRSLTMEIYKTEINNILKKM